MHKPIQERLIVGGLAVAALPFMICSVPWAHASFDASFSLRPWVHITLEASLNILWFLLAVGTLIHCLKPKNGRRGIAWLRLVSLIFIFSLLFPVISANDDWAQMALINDAANSQAITVQSDKQLVSSTEVLGAPAASLPQWASPLSLHFEYIAESASADSSTTPRHATGNHSPPLY